MTQQLKQTPNTHLNSISPLIILLGVGLISATTGVAHSQDSFDITVVNPDAMFEPIGPPPLPGHEKGERKREHEHVADQPPPASSEWFGGDPWGEWSRATGDWSGLRNDWENTGVTIEGAFIFDWSSVTSGGIISGDSSRHLLDLNLTLDLETMWDIPHATVFIDFYSAAGDSVSAEAGDFQGISNIEVGRSVDQIAELWYEQWILDEKLRFKIGKVEGNSEFAFVDAAGEFISSSAGISPTIFTIPTYPDPAMSVNLFYYPTEQSYFGFGFYDGAAAVDGVATGRRGPSTFFSSSLSDDYFFIGEFGYSWDTLKEWGPGRLALGMWHHTGDHATFSGGIDSGTEGFYALAEQRLWASDSDSEQGLWGFLQYGFADAEVSAAEHHLAGGVLLQGTFANRDDDSAGLYISQAVLSDEPGAGFTDDETTIELFYKIQLTPFFSLKPDIQFILNPGGVSTVDDATVISLRAELTF